jgi:hypothetical protein
MANGERRITSMGCGGGGTETGGQWEAHVTLDNDDYILATGSSEQQAYENLAINAKAAGLEHQFSAFQAMFPSGALEGDVWAESSNELSPPSTPYTHQFRLDPETDEYITPMLIGSGEVVEARGATLAEADRNLFQKLRDLGLDVHHMAELEWLRESIARHQAAVLRSPGGQPLPPFFDYNRAFEDGLSFESQHQLVIGPVTIHVVDAGELNVPSGWVVVRDPGILPNPDADESALERRIPPGRYPVLISVAQFEREAREVCAMLRIGATPAVRWEQAAEVGQDFTKLKPGDSFGFGVDTGMGFFGDIEAARLLTADERAQKHWLETRPIYKAICDGMDRNRHFANVMVDLSRELNVIAFHTGWGDGGYPTFWGFDADGCVTALVADFELLRPEDWDRPFILRTG